MRNEPAAVKFLDLDPIARVQGTVRMPGSKSISNRVLLLAALADGETRLENLLDSDDTGVMLNALELLGVRIERDSATVRGGAFPNKSADLRLGNAGTAFRPLTAVLALAGGEYRLSGAPRMHERPIGDLVDALRTLGARIDYLGAADGGTAFGIGNADRSRGRADLETLRRDHPERHATLRRRGAARGLEVVHGSGQALLEPRGDPRRGRRLLGLVFPRGGRDRRGPGTGGRRGAFEHPGRYPLHRGAGEDGGEHLDGRRLDRIRGSGPW